MKDISQYIGIFLGVVYGLFVRVIVDIDSIGDYYGIYSVTFIWITPIIIGLIPILFTSNEVYKSNLKLFFYPITTVLLFLITAVVSGLEDFICFIIIGFPFIIASGFLGFMVGILLKKRVENKKLYSVLLIPFLINPIESLLPNKSELYVVSSEIVIHNIPENIFPNLLNVPVIADHEFKEGMYNSLGVPRPMYSQMFSDSSGTYRIGYFTENLRLYEYVTAIRENEFVNFKIDLSKSVLRDKPTDQHVLKNSYFHFENISYSLHSIGVNQTKVVLSCEYQISSKMNFYANYWAKSIITDFEERLLASLKLKLDEL